jgi:hypothetical protein
MRWGGAARRFALILLEGARGPFVPRAKRSLPSRYLDGLDVESGEQL